MPASMSAGGAYLAEAARELGVVRHDRLAQGEYVHLLYLQANILTS
jgi:hypothetical protein